MSDRELDPWRLLGLGLLGTAVACVPRVPASLVVEQPRPLEQAPTAKPEAEPSGPDRTPPKITRAELVGSTSLRIHFSEPIVAPDDFDPSDFRISHLRVYFERRAAAYSAYYYDANRFDYGYSSPPVVLSQARFGEDTLDLAVTPQLSPVRCREMEYVEHYVPPGVSSDEALFLHYAAGQIPIRDGAGNALADFGADWVILGRSQPEQPSQTAGEPAKQVWSTSVRVACGPPIPPGPR